MRNILDDLRENPFVALYFWEWNAKRCFLVKVDPCILTGGEGMKRCWHR
jgi:hypothetical protein